jgi:integrative and conjugative element protein (TIGR02256 family)
MQCLADWACPSTGVIVVFAPSTIDTFNRYVQDEDKSEAGGILIGYRRGDHFEVTHATEPTKFDKRSRVHFERLPAIHAETASKLWTDSNGHITYIGEWHTHPEKFPSPSVTDIAEWKNLSKQQTSNNSLVMTIIGTKEIWVGLAKSNGQLNPLRSLPRSS